MKPLAVLNKYTDVCGQAWADYARDHADNVGGAWVKYVATINAAQVEYRDAKGTR